MVRSQAPAVSATSARRTASWPRSNGVVSRGQGRRGGTAGVVEAIIALLARLLGGARDQRTAVDQRGAGLARPYGPRYSNCPTRDERPEYSKLMFGSVNLSTVDRRTLAGPV